MTASHHRIHGLAGEEAAPDWQPLDAAELEALLSGFTALHGSTHILWHSPRPYSAAALVRTPAGDVFVKRQHVQVRTRQALLEEHAFIAHLRDGGLPVPQVLADDDGNTAILRGDRICEVHAVPTGIDLYRDAPSWTPLTRLGHARQAGRMLARLHRVAAGFDASRRGTSLLVARDDLLRSPDPVAFIEAQCARRPMLAGYLSARDWRGELAPLLARHRLLQPRIAELPRLWTHGDWHASNLFWSSADDDAEATAILDFGLCAPTFALYDLATAIERNAIAWLDPERGMQAVFPETARALIAGYAEELPLDAAQRALLADLLPLVHIDFALSEIDYFHGILGSRKQADLAWEGFLLGHAAWFDGEPGRVLLDAIRDAAD